MAALALFVQMQNSSKGIQTRKSAYGRALPDLASEESAQRAHVLHSMQGMACMHARKLTKTAFVGADVPCAHQTEALLSGTSAGVDHSDIQGTEISAHVKAKGSPSLLLCSLLSHHVHQKLTARGDLCGAQVATSSIACCGNASSCLSPQ